VAEDVIVGRELGFDSGDGDEAAQPEIHSLRNLWNVDVDVLKRGVEAVFVVIV